MSRPSKRTVPLVGSSRRVITRASVDLPHPDSPTIPSVSPRRTWSETPSSALTDATSCLNTMPSVIGKCFVTSATSSRTSAHAARLVEPELGDHPHRLLELPVLGEKACVEVVRVEAGTRRLRQLAAAAVEGEAAARPEPAAGGRAKERGRLTADLRQALELDVEPRQRAEETPGVRVEWMLEQRVDRRVLRDAGGVHDDDLVRRLGDDAEIVRDEDHGGPVLGLELPDQVEDLRLRRDVERRGRLVRDEERRVVDQGHRDHHALAHPAGELVRVVVDPLLGPRDPDLLQPRDRKLARLASRDVAVEASRPRRAGSRSRAPG